MKIKVLKKENYIQSKWSGGNTRQLAIYPETADYLKRDFIWRLSSADSNLEESSFTKLPGFDRILMVLQGQVVLSHGGERSVKLSEGEQDSFCGDIKTTCFGVLKKDYNLIMQKGCKGQLELLKLTGDGIHKQLNETGSLGVYVEEGYAVVNIKGESKMVNADEQLVVQCEGEELCQMSIMGEGKIVFSKVIYDIEDFLMTEIPEGKASAADFSTAFGMYIKNNRWSNILKHNKPTGLWKSPKLEKALKRLDKYGITTIVWCIELILAFGSITLGVSTTMASIFAVAITALHVLFIGPMIYMVLLPKPISAHLKPVENLNAAELKDYERQQKENERLDKLMAKYNQKDGNYFADENSPLYKFRMKK